MANERELDRAKVPPVGDIGQMWRQQPGRHDVRADQIRSKARAFDERVQRWNFVGGLTVALLIVKNVWEVAVDADVIERSGDALLLAGLLYVAYRFIRHARATTRPAALGETTCVEHYRAQLLRQRELSRDSWKFILPFVPGFGLIIAGRALEGRPPSQVGALIVFACGLFAGVVWVIARRTRKVEREIAALESQ
jgi:hypothetical protein